jgi:hypothetical protein
MFSKSTLPHPSNPIKSIIGAFFLILKNKSLRMRFAYFFCFSAFALLFAYNVAGQITFYQHDTSVKVYAYGQPQTLAWCGGFNNPQFSMGDLNHDGLKDLVAFEPGLGVQTFINKGFPGSPKYQYAPEYALNFPAIYGYLALADYNCDGIVDLFQRGSFGYAVYKGYFNAFNQLCFTFYRDLFYSNDVSVGYANAYVNPGDVPAIVDVDNDGDLDFVSYYITGGNMYLYKNMRVELGLPCDSIHIALKDRCWGKVYQGFYRTHMLGYTCSNAGLMRMMTDPAGKTTHSGNTPTLFDWDMDGDYDYLDGSVSFNEMTFLKNGKVENSKPVDTMISQDTMWQSGGTTINIPIWPTAFNIDIDLDGKKDILVSPNAGSASENYKCVWYYKNLSTTGTPSWQFQSDSFLVNKSIDLGTAAYPMLFDYDKDGKPDLFIGSDGYYQSSGLLRSKILYYKNTSTAGNPSFTLESNDFMGLFANNYRGAAPATGDIDNDSISDMLVGHSDGTITYFKNSATSESVQPAWVLAQAQLTDVFGNVINVDGNAAPFIYDIDKDGKKDLVIGNIYGYIQYYQNVSTTPGAIALKLINTRLGDAKADPVQNLGNYSVPFIGKIDSTGSNFLLMGSNSGNIYQFTGFQTGDTTATYTMLDQSYSYIDTTYSAYNHPGEYYGVYGNLRSALTVGDIDNSGSLTMIVGNVRGGVEFYKRKVYTVQIPPVPSDEPVIHIYPNPANNLLNVSWMGFQNPMVQVSIINVEGRRFYTNSFPSALNFTSIPLDNLAAGMYICVLQSGNFKHYTKVTVIH